MNDVHLDTVEPVPIIPLLLGLAHPSFSDVLAFESLGTDLVSGTSPHSNLHLVVRIVCSRVEDIDLAGLEVCPDISFPEVPGGSDRAPEPDLQPIEHPEDAV